MTNLMVIAQIDVFGGGEITDYLFKFSQYKPLNEYFATFGFDDMNFLTNTGSMILPILPAMVLTKLGGYALHKYAIKHYQ